MDEQDEKGVDYSDFFADDEGMSDLWKCISIISWVVGVNAAIAATWWLLS